VLVVYRYVHRRAARLAFCGHFLLLTFFKNRPVVGSRLGIGFFFDDTNFGGLAISISPSFGIAVGDCGGGVAAGFVLTVTGSPLCTIAFVV